MDHMRDAKPFHELLDELCATLREGFKSTEAMRNAYWDALKDRPFAEIRANAKRIMATATKDTRFPKPAELRNHPAQEYREGPKHQAATRLCEETWRELKARDPVRFHVEFSIARAARELATLHVLDPAYTEWTREYERWAALRYAPPEVQAQAVARVKDRPAA